MEMEAGNGVVNVKQQIEILNCKFHYVSPVVVMGYIPPCIPLKRLHFDFSLMFKLLLNV